MELAVELTKSRDVADFFSRLLLLRQGIRKTYSLRTLARMLGVSPSMLSSVIQKKRYLSKERAISIALNPVFSEVERRHFLILYDLDQVVLDESKKCLCTYFGVDLT